jgi:hypothetical protein
MRNHVTHLLPAYVHRQLPRAKRDRVLVHIQLCAECRAALDREEQFARDLKTNMPLIGQPRRQQLMRLWPAIWAEFRSPRPRRKHGIHSYGVALGMLLLGAFMLSAVFSGPAYASAAPSQPVVAEIHATSTSVGTDEPTVVANVPEPSETASSLSSLPMASPAPLAGLGEPVPEQ